ncbi:three-Cys-motif partner protein TcmP [Pseudodesulfovibrio tunisiensis]|uniref:three-Cys-motif partner protein TcmP n=1 Tax=Pseudodesulfovibrio tunisiensis TaxID=463192 RepID=UPI001FB350A3|nr:three-Cys-motif partner protein TcmP [Pseudodesulfovibrio tunisiensis]
MHNSHFFQDSFDEGTHTKLTLLEKYVRAWIPTFIHTNRIKEIQMFDPFCGPGTTEKGDKGSPLIVLREAVRYARKYSSSARPPIRLFFSDSKLKELEQLQTNPEIENAKKYIDVRITHMNFRDLFEKSRHSRKDPSIAAFFFIDQFGVKELSCDIFFDLVNSPRTDWLAFMSSSTARRFLKEECFKSIPQANFGALKDCHRELTEAYRQLANNPEYFILPFSIKKGTNIYGLIFGYRSPTRCG